MPRDDGIAMSWFVKVEGQIYGPYTPAQMRAFVGEGRIAAHSLVSDERDGEFAAASTQDALSDWFSEDDGGTQVEKRVTPGARPANFVIVGEIASDKAGEFRVRFKYNSEIMFSTEGYSSKDSAKNAIASIQKNGPGAPIEDNS